MLLLQAFPVVEMQENVVVVEELLLLLALERMNFWRRAQRENSSWAQRF
jgi:hypothetical protein